MKFQGFKKSVFVRGFCIFVLTAATALSAGCSEEDLIPVNTNGLNDNTGNTNTGGNNTGGNNTGNTGGNNDGSPILTWTMTDACNDGLPTELVFHEAQGGRLTGFQWPGNNQAFILNGTESYPLACTVGNNICYGARPQNNQNTFWGVGAFGNQSCTDCCYTCEQGTNNVQPISLQC